MKSVPAFITLFIFITSLQAQELDNDSIQAVTDTLIVAEENENEEKLPVAWSIYVEYLPEYAPHLNDYGFNQQFGVGGTYGGIHAGFFFNYLREGIRKQLIFPNHFDLIFLHNGGYLGTDLLSKDPVYISLRYNFSFGTMVWENSETRADLVRENFFMSKPEITIQYTLVRIMAAYASIGYKIGHGVEIPGVEQNDFNGIAAGVGIRFGFFQSGL